MAEKKYSETSDKFLCDILSQKCNDFLSTYSTTSSRQFIQISESIKFTSTQIKTTNTIIKKSKIVYSNVVTNPVIQKIAKEQTEEFRKKQSQLLAELMKKIKENIKANLEEVLTSITQYTNKDIFKSVIYTLEEEYQSVNDELERVYRYTKKKQIRDVFNLEINNICPCEFVEIILESLPVLKGYLDKFDLETLTNQQIDQLKQQSELVDSLIDFNPLLQKRLKQKKQKKRQNKKKSKNKTKQQNQTNQQQKCDNWVLDEQDQEETKIIEFLNSLVINERRLTCDVSHDWVLNMKSKYF